MKDEKRLSSFVVPPFPNLTNTHVLQISQIHCYSLSVSLDQTTYIREEVGFICHTPFPNLTNTHVLHISQIHCYSLSVSLKLYEKFVVPLFPISQTHTFFKFHKFTATACLSLLIKLRIYEKRLGSFVIPLFPISQTHTFFKLHKFTATACLSLSNYTYVIGIYTSSHTPGSVYCNTFSSEEFVNSNY